MGGELRCGVAFRARRRRRIGLSRERGSIRTGKTLGRVFAFRGAFSAQKPTFPAFEHQRGEDRGRERSGVDVNPIWQNVRARDGRVSVHDYLAPRALVAEEFFPDPKQILRVLALRRDAGPDARVAEEIIAETRREAGLLQKQAVPGRHARQETFSREVIAGPAHRLRHVDAI